MSKREIQEPVEVGPTLHGDGKRYAHPAFGLIGASRVSGSKVLNGTDFVHNSFIRVQISRGELNRDLSRDWYFPKEEIIEVDLSEAQWATFVSAMNVGSGVPCTIYHKDGVLAPELPYRTQDTAFKNEVRGKLAESIARLDKLEEKVKSSGLSKAKQTDLLNEVRSARREIGANLPFVADSFDEHVENRVEAAKQEVHGYMTGVIMAAGVQAIAQAPLALEPPVEYRDVVAECGGDVRSAEALLRHEASQRGEATAFVEVDE